jgi:hypothetical protein
VSDQWGQPQNPYGGGPQGPYGQPQQPQGPYYGQPVQQPQGPYGQQPQPGPYGPAQPQSPYGLPPTQPMQQPPFPQQPQNPYDPYGQQQPGYGFPQQPGAPADPKKKQNMIISGAVVGVLVIAAVAFFALKGNGSNSGGGGGAGGTGTVTNAGSQTQTQSCASWKTEQDTMNNQNPNTESDMVALLAQDVPAMQAISTKAAAGSFKTDMSKVVGDFSELYTYLQANPNLDTSTSTPPAEFVTIDEAITTDTSALDSLCGLPDAGDSTDSGSGSGF